MGWVVDGTDPVETPRWKLLGSAACAQTKESKRLVAQVPLGSIGEMGDPALHLDERKLKLAAL